MSFRKHKMLPTPEDVLTTLHFGAPESVQTTYDGFHNIHDFDYFAKYHVPAVEPFSDLRRDEEPSTDSTRPTVKPHASLLRTQC